MAKKSKRMIQVETLALLAIVNFDFMSVFHVLGGAAVVVDPTDVPEAVYDGLIDLTDGAATIYNYLMVGVYIAPKIVERFPWLEEMSVEKVTSQVDCRSCDQSCASAEMCPALKLLDDFIKEHGEHQQFELVTLKEANAQGNLMDCLRKTTELFEAISDGGLN